MDGLTAKVFRTYNASYTLQRELRENPANFVSPSALESHKLLIYNKANTTVAILCNHQRSVPKGHEGAVKKMTRKLEELEDEKEEIEDALDELKKSKQTLTKPEREKRRKLREKRMKERLAAQKAEEAEKKAAGSPAGGNASTNASPGADDDDGDNETDELARKKKSLPTDAGKLELKLEKLLIRITNERNKLAARDETKTVALGTSKINYMDPRISVAWCKAKELPIERVFNKSLVAKFPWAMEVPSDWTF